MMTPWAGSAQPLSPSPTVNSLTNSVTATGLKWGLEEPRGSDICLRFHLNVGVQMQITEQAVLKPSLSPCSWEPKPGRG